MTVCGALSSCSALTAFTRYADPMSFHSQPRRLVDCCCVAAEQRAGKPKAAPAAGRARCYRPPSAIGMLKELAGA